MSSGLNRSGVSFHIRLKTNAYARRILYLPWTDCVIPMLVHVAVLASLITFATEVSATLGAWAKGMYCMRGNIANVDDRNTNAAILPLVGLTKKDWWFHHVNRCDEFPPDDGVFLEIPANGKFTIEHAVNRVFTTTAPSWPVLGAFGDGKDHPGLGTTRNGKKDGSDCIVEPNIHTQNETMASGTAFAVSYQFELANVTPENLVVFSVLYNTPWKRLATYSAPDLPACPKKGCICAWGWIPNGCGTQDMFMQGFRCKVTQASSKHSLAPAKPPKWCEINPRRCVVGAKQMVYWRQLDGNNVEVSGLDKSGNLRSPGYNGKMGFSNGAQNDIFL